MNWKNLLQDLLGCWCSYRYTSDTERICVKCGRKEYLVEEYLGLGICADGDWRPVKVWRECLKIDK